MKRIGRILSIPKTCFIVFSIAVYAVSFVNFSLLSKDMIHGDRSGEKIFPPPMYGLYRVPDRPNTIERNAVDRLAADYAQVYFPSLEFQALTRNYETGYLDPWYRPSRYAPFIHYLCAISFCRLDYGYASFLHMLIQLLLFYIFFAAAFRMLNIESDLHVGLLVATLILFLTPAGLSWFERGQFSLYVALAYLFLILGLLKNNRVFVIISALFAYVKWTSFPFLFVVIAVHWLGSRNAKERLQNTQTGLFYLLIILVLSLAFRSKFIHFAQGLYWQEAFVEPNGISMAYLLPRNFIKGIPVLLIFLGYLSLKWNNNGFDTLAPFWIGSGIFLLTYPTVAFEYNIPSLFCFIPLVSYWEKRAGALAATVGKIKYLLFAFLILYSWTYYMNPVGNAKIILFGYLMVSIVFLSFAFLNRSHQAGIQHLSE